MNDLNRPENTSILNAELHLVGSFPDSKVHGPTRGPYGADRTQMVAMLVTWTLLSGLLFLLS